MNYYFYTVFIGPVIVLLLGLYLFFKTKKQLQILQQSVYDNKRYLTHMKLNKQQYIALNELLTLATVFLYYFSPIIACSILLILTYYNLRFLNMSTIRFKAKKQLVVTKRIQRLLLTIIIISTVSSYLLAMILPIYYVLVAITWIMPLIVLVSNAINIPIERHIQNKFKKMAMKKLAQSRDLFVIGITGSYGKTSIKNIVNDMLGEFEPTLMTPASFNTPNGISITVNNHLNPLYRNFICEMGAYYKGEIEELAVMVDPDVAIVSSIGPQHLETFKTIENIQATKMELVENLVTGGVAILNYDNQYIKNYQVNRKDIKVYSYGLDSTNYDLYATNIEYLNDGMSFTVIDNTTNRNYEIKTKLLGKHNIYNVLAALIVCKVKGYDLDRTCQLFNKVKPVEHRLQLKKISDDTIIIDDAFNGNREGILEGITILSKYEGYKKIIITPGLIDMGTMSDEAHYAIGQKIAQCVDEAMIVGKLNWQAIKNGFETEQTNCNIENYDNFLTAYGQAMAIPGKKVVLIANDLPDKFN